MEQKSKGTNAGHEKKPGTDTGQFKPGKSERPRKGPTGIPGATDAPAVERSEDFGKRRDIETADEPTEEHDRRHHDEDAEVGRPA
jgi:hypothetical protein